jgi:hypothetical protein
VGGGLFNLKTILIGFKGFLRQTMRHLSCRSHEGIQGEQKYTDYSQFQRPMKMNYYQAPAAFIL